VYKATDRHVEPENSEEYSVALLAFNEAINAYDEEKHSNFLVFSEQVINRRLIDYKEKIIRIKWFILFLTLKTKISNLKELFRMLTAQCN